MGVANDPATVFLFILLSCIGINSQLTMSQDQVDDGATCLQKDTTNDGCCSEPEDGHKESGKEETTNKETVESKKEETTDKETAESKKEETANIKESKATEGACSSSSNEVCKVKEKSANKKKGDQRKLSFSKTLNGFGYEFADNELRNIKTKERFVFEVYKGDKEYNQKHYEAIGEVITEEVYQLLESRAGLRREPIPLNKKPKEAGSFIFTSPNIADSDNLMILIHGSGVVRAGQWARRLIINDNLDSGTQLPFIKRATEEGYGVIVMNTNRNEEEIDGKKLKIKGSRTPEEHAQYVWKHFILKSKARNIYIVAHSYGGVVTVELMKEYFDDFKKRVRKIAFTDSVHSLDLHNVKSSTRRWISANAINWVTSPDPLDTPINTKHNNVPKLSAGTIKHEETSFSSFESIFKYFSEQK